VLSIPALTALTSAMLSFDVRPFTDGTVIGGSLAAVSFPIPDAVLDVVLTRIGLAAAATGTICGVDEAIRASVGTASPPGEGRASLAAAQASAVASVNERSMGMDVDLWDSYCISSMEELWFAAIGGSSAWLIHNPGPRYLRSRCTPHSRFPSTIGGGNPSCFRDMFGIF
jgi:hypothetical protein